MINGIDVHLRTRADSVACEAAVRAIRLYWPSAVFEDGLSGDLYGSFEAIPFGEIEEVFVYKDQGAATLWGADGAVDDALNRMIHLISDPGWLTVVVDAMDSEMDEMINAIRSLLYDLISLKKAA
jgi:hypothetical protein